MGHWVTLDDDQHVYISDSGKVLATHAAISKASGGTERGKALAARSKAAILKKKGGGAAKTSPQPPATPSLREQAAAARAGKEPKIVPPDRLIRSGRKFYTPAQMTATLKAAGKKQATIDEFLKNPPGQRSTDPMVGAMIGRLRAFKNRTPR